MEKKNIWENYSAKQLKELEKLNEEYRDFLDNGKTERECIDTIVNTIEAAGYRELGTLIKAGFKSVAYSITFRAKDRTLEESDVAAAMKKILNGLEQLGIELRQ